MLFLPGVRSTLGWVLACVASILFQSLVQSFDCGRIKLVDSVVKLIEERDATSILNACIVYISIFMLSC